MSTPLSRTSYAYSRVEAPRVQTMDAESGLDRCIANLKKNVEKDLEALKTQKKISVCAPIAFAATTIPIVAVCSPAHIFMPIYYTFLTTPFICLTFCAADPKSTSRLKLINEALTPEKQRELALDYLNKTEFLTAIDLADNIADPEIQSSLYSDICMFLINRNGEKNAESVTRIVEIIQKIQNPEIKRRVTGDLFRELRLHLKGIQDLLGGIETTSPISMETALAKIAKCPHYGTEIKSTIEAFFHETPLSATEKEELLKSIGGPFIRELMPLLV